MVRLAKFILRVRKSFLVFCGYELLCVFRRSFLLLSRDALGGWVCEYRGPDTGLGGVSLQSRLHWGWGKIGLKRWTEVTAVGSERKGWIENDSCFPTWVYDLHLFRRERVWKWEHNWQETRLIYIFILTYSTHLLQAFQNEQEFVHLSQWPNFISFLDDF